MKWFKHFSNAHNDNALTKVRMRYGADGYAIYWYCLELIAADLGNENGNINFELRHDAEVIAFNLRVDSAKVEEIMRYLVNLGLFETANNKVTCLKLAKFLDKKVTRNSEIHKIIDASKGITANVGDSLPTNTDCPDLSTLDEIRLDNNITANAAVGCRYSFNDFYNNYPVKKNKQSALKAWNRLSVQDKQNAVDRFHDYVAAKKPDVAFCHPSTYLNQKRWEDEPESNIVQIAQVRRHVD